MATQGTFYLDAPSFGAATVLYSDVNLTTVAPDGFYSDGTIVREQVSGVLLPQTTCPSCATPCGGSISASGGQGIYYLDTDLGTDTGAVIIQFDPYSVPDGVMATLGSANYNGLSSPIFGWLQGDDNMPTYIGDSSANCSVPTGSPYTLSEFEYNGTSFAPLGTTTSVPIYPGQLQFTTGAPGTCIMVVPKTTAAPSILSIQFIGPCSGTAFNIGVSCPAALTSFDSSVVAASDTLACALTVNQTYYVAHVTGALGTLGIYDLVFSDPNGEFKLAAGYYKTTDAGTNNWFQVDANGVIIGFGTCGSEPSLAVTSAFGYMEPCIGGTIDDHMGASVSLNGPVAADTTFNVDVSYVIPPNSCGGSTSIQSFTVEILAGQSSSSFNACASGAYFSSGATICSTCISACSDPAIDLTGFTC